MYRLNDLGAAIDRAWQSLVAGVVVVVLLLGLAFDSGGYFPATFLTAGTIAYAAVAVLLIARRPRHAFPTAALVAIAALVGLGLWTGLSARWSPFPSAASQDMQRTLAYAAVFTLALLAAGSGRYSRHLAWTVLGVIVVVCGAGLLSRLEPELVSARPLGELFADVTRLAHPFTYWNALGAMAAMGAVLATGMAADGRAPVALRGVAAGAAVVVAVTGYLTFSRGAWLAFFVGMVVLLIASGGRVQLGVTLALVGLPVLSAVLRLRAYPEVTAPGEMPTGARGYTLTLAGLAAMAAGAQIAAALLLERARRAIEPVRGRLGLMTGVSALMLALGLYAFQAARIEGGTAQMVVDVERFVDREWDNFMTPTAFSESGPERLTTAQGTRSHVYGVAIDGFEAHPLRGDGSGSFEFRYLHHPDTRDKVRDAHSLYFETLAELGLVGFLALLAFLGAVVYALVRTRVKRGGLSRAQAAAVGAGFSVWMFHAGVDWDWEMPGLTATAMALAAAAFPQGRRRGRRRVQPQAAVLSSSS